MPAKNDYAVYWRNRVMAFAGKPRSCGFCVDPKQRCEFSHPTLTCGHVLRGRLCIFIFLVSAALSWVRWRFWPKSWAIT
ncbi:hypothetical protein EB795_10605 [Pseudomonas mandelii]|nr:hypothetical protein [Pseudomonas mandelii]